MGRARPPTAIALPGAPSFHGSAGLSCACHLYLTENDDGRMEVWQDGEKVIAARGQTLPTARTVYDRLQVGLTANSNREQSHTCYVDDVTISNRPLEN